MKRQIPEQLCNPDFRFILVKNNTKLPIENSWNNTNNYMYFEPKLLNHLLRGGNLAAICGFGNLIVIDFDDADFQKEKEALMPKTFTCRSAGKGLKHFYYILKGDMIKKVGLDSCGKCKNPNLISKTKKETDDYMLFCEGCNKWVLAVRMADIQANKSPITCSPSSINGKIYAVVDDAPIQEIDYETLSKIFGIELQKRHLKGEINYEPQPLKVQEAIDTLKRLGVKRARANRFHCPFHESNGSGNLCIFPSGKIKCFHCDFFNF